MFNLFLQHYTPETEETIWSMEEWPGTDTKKRYKYTGNEYKYPT